MSAIIELKNVSKTFYDNKDALHILENVNLSIRKGESIAIIGPSGSGKSTLLHIASLLENPTDGCVIVDGKDTTKLSDKKRAEIRGKLFSFMFQNDPLFASWSLEDNALLEVVLKRRVQKSDREKFHSLLDILSLSGREKTKVKKLSGGEKSRVSLLRSLLSDAEVMFLDEPTGSLDRDNAVLVENLIFELSEKYGKTVILVTHSKSMAERAKRIYEIYSKSLRCVK